MSVWFAVEGELEEGGAIVGFEFREERGVEIEVNVRPGLLDERRERSDFFEQHVVEFVYEGFYHDPLKTDLEAFLASSQTTVNGEVVLRTNGGNVEAVAVKSPHLLTAKGATYAQSADWGVAEAEGFIRLYGMSSTLWAQVNRKT